MKDLNFRAEKHRNDLIAVLGMSVAEYKLHQIDAMHKYVANYAKNDFRIASKLLNSRIFENWFVNKWNRRNSYLYHQFCISSYLNREGLGRQLRISRWKLHEMYEQTHKMNPAVEYPNSAVWELMDEENTAL
jgi:hypothetical protein